MQHLKKAVKTAESHSETIRELVPNYSCRMDDLRAAILRPQLEILDDQCQRWNRRYQQLEIF